MAKLSLAEFQKLSGISDQSLVWLLTNNMLRCEYHEERGLEVDVASAEIKDLIRSIAIRKQSALETQEKLLCQKFTRIISNRMSEMMDEAMRRLNARNG